MSYAAEKLEVIPNGFDLEQVKPDPTARASVRKELGIPADAILIGIAARFHPHKDHRSLVQSVARLQERMPEIHFLMCGMDIAWQNLELAEWIESADIGNWCHLLGRRTDMARLFAGLDIATSSSRSEAFPIAIGEAMACGAPCVVTDVGDCALIVGETGTVVAPGDPEALAEAWRNLIEAGPRVRHPLGIAARRRVQQHFALPVIVERYPTIYSRFAAW